MVSKSRGAVPQASTCGADHVNYLERRSETYYAVVPVPKHLWGAAGKRKTARSINTKKRDEALRRLPAILSANPTKPQPCPRPKAVKDALPVALDFAPRFRRADSKVIIDRDLRLTERDKVGDAIDSTADDIFGPMSDVEGKLGAEERLQFHQIARGEKLPLAVVLDRWIAEEGGRYRSAATLTKARHIARLLTEHFSPHYAIQDADRGEITEFIRTELLKKRGITTKTVNNLLSPLRKMWQWSQNRGYIPAGDITWTKQVTVHKHDIGDGTGKLPPRSTDELVVLLRARFENR